MTEKKRTVVLSGSAMAAYFEQLARAHEREVYIHNKLTAAGFTCIGGCYMAPPGLTQAEINALFKEDPT